MSTKYNIIVSVLLFFAFLPLQGFAQISSPSSSGIIITWDTNTYAPPEFSGKRFPIANSTINLGLDFIDKGEKVNLQEHIIQWYINGSLLKEERGLGSIIIHAPDIPGKSLINVRVQVLQYEGKLLKKTIKIPIVTPDVVIKSPYFRNIITSSPSVFAALPYFFNINSLADVQMRWRVNNTLVEDLTDPENLSVDIPSVPSSNNNLTIELRVQHLERIFENIVQTVNLSYIP